MYYKNNNINVQTAVLMLKHPENRKLIKVIYDVYKEIDTELIDDVDTKNMVNLIKDASKTAVEDFIVDKAIMNLVFESGKQNISAVFARNIADGVTNNEYSKEILQSMVEFYASKKYSDKFSYLKNSITEKINTYLDSNISTMKKAKAELVSTQSEITESFNHFLNDTQKRDILIMDVQNEDPDDDIIIGRDELIEDSETSASIALRTGLPVIDNILGALRSSKLYVLASIAGGFKSGAMINMVEGICLNNPIELNDPLLEDGMKPCVLHVSLEDTKLQILKKRAAFHQIDVGKIEADYHNKIALAKCDEEIRRIPPIPEQILEGVSKCYNRDGGDYMYPRPIYRNANMFEYGSQDLYIDESRLREEGYQVICVFIDYLGIVKYEARAGDQEAKILPLTRAGYRFKGVAKKLAIPVISATQINRGGEEVLREAEARGIGEYDFIRVWNASALAGAHALKQVPDMFAFVYAYDIGKNKYFSMLLDKDRGNDSNVDSKRVEIGGDNGNGQRRRGSAKRMDRRPHMVSRMKGFSIGEGDCKFGRTITDVRTNDAANIIKILGSDPISPGIQERDKVLLK